MSIANLTLKVVQRGTGIAVGLVVKVCCKSAALFARVGKASPTGRVIGKCDL